MSLRSQDGLGGLPRFSGWRGSYKADDILHIYRHLRDVQHVPRYGHIAVNTNPTYGKFRTEWLISCTLNTSCLKRLIWDL